MKPIRQKLYGIDPYENFDPSWAEPDFQGWGHEHGGFLASIKRVKPKLIIEIGTWKGASAIRMAQACREQGLDTEIVCVDTWLGSPGGLIHTGTDSQKMRFDSMRYVNGYPMLYYTFMRNVVDAGVQDMITPLAQTSEHGAKILRAYGVQADMIYLDTVEEKEPVYRDLRSYWPLLRKGGLLLGDDYKNDEVRAGVEKFSKYISHKPEALGGKYRFTKTKG